VSRFREKNLSEIDHEAEYNNRARVPEHPAIFTRWARAAEAFRASHPDAELGVAYGRSSREKIDIFWPRAGRDAPIAFFIHGGYWRSLDPSAFSHLAAGPNAHGIALALIGYDLCPGVSMETIIDQVRAAALHLYGRYGRRHLVASGHSAGGHLSACLVATDWKKLDAGLPEDLVPAGLSISGLFGLAPLMRTSMNQDLRIEAKNVERISPLGWNVGLDRIFDAWVGGDESSEFLRHSREIADVWAKRGVATRYVAVPHTNHFTVLDPLADPSSEMCLRLVELAKAYD
jgi:arylformamidase